MKPPPALLSALLLTFAWAPGPAALGADDSFKPAPAPAWQLKDPDGREVTSAQFKHKVVVLDFWATWCGPCRSEIPGYVALRRKYAAAGLEIIGVSVDQGGPEVVKQFAAAQQMDYPVVLADDAIVSAFGGVDAIPTTFIIDRDGVIRYRKVGAMPAAEFEEILQRYLR